MFVNLSRYPLNTAEARAIAAALRDGASPPSDGRRNGPPNRSRPATGRRSSAITANCYGVNRSAQEREAPNGGIAVPIQCARAQRLALLRADRGQSSNAGRLGILTSIREEERKYLEGDADEIWQIMRSRSATSRAESTRSHHT